VAKALFDRDEVLDRAIDLFWDHGFSASSMQQVVKATGLNPGSIYHAFGSKEALFREALQRYGERSIERIRSTLDAAPSVGEGIRAHLERTLLDSTGERFRSCFLVKTQLECGVDDSALHRVAAARLAEVEEVFRSYLRREFSEEVSRRRAASVMLHMFGMRVYGYQMGPPEQMREGLREGLPWVPWD
jgi:TetR/AcrR family transcriptional repressor of nem operon